MTLLSPRLSMLLLALLVGRGCGCAFTKPTHLEREMERMIDCMYRAARQDGITCRQALDLQQGCYDLYKMRTPEVQRAR